MGTITGVTAVPERPRPILSALVAPEAEKITEVPTETSKPTEFLVFAKTTGYSNEAPRVTATQKSIIESTGAATASTQSSPALFTTDNEGRFVVSTAASHTAGSTTALASALSGAESNEKGHDKKEKGNSFLASHKTKEDIRLEALEKYDIRESILSLC